MCTHFLMRITRQVKNVLQNKARNYYIIYYFYFIFAKNMDFAAWFDDVRRMNKRQVSSYVVILPVLCERVCTPMQRVCLEVGFRFEFDKVYYYLFIPF